MLRSSDKGLNVKARRAKTTRALIALSRFARQALHLLLWGWLIGLSSVALSQNKGSITRTTSTTSVAGSGGVKIGGVVSESALYRNEKLTNYVNQVGQRLIDASGLYDGAGFSFYVLNDPSSNAMATEDGNIFVTLGILALMTSEDHLAAILGHEIAHVTRRHLAKRKSSAAAKRVLGNIASIGSYYATGSNAISQATGGLSGYINEAWITGYGRNQELDADGVGLKYLVQAGYRHEAMLEVLTLTKQQQLLQKRFRRARKQLITYHGVQSTHPAADKRLQESLDMTERTPIVFNELGPIADYLEIVDGLPFGRISDEGVSQDNVYLNRSLNLEAQFPEGWDIKPASGELLSAPKEGADKAYYLLKVAAVPKNTDVETLERALGAELDGRQLSRVKPLSGGRMHGISAILVPDQPQHKAQWAALVCNENSAFLILAALSDKAYARPWQVGFDALLASIGTPDASSAFQAGRNRIGVILTKPGDTYESLVGKLPHLSPAERTYFANYLRLINGDYPRGQIGEGERIKVIL